MTPDEKVARLAEGQHSVITHAQALRCGFTQEQIDGRVRRGSWVRLHRGVYRLTGSTFPFEGRAIAAAFAAGDGAVVSHTTAGRLFALEGVSTNEIHITVARPRRARIRGVVVHQATMTLAKDSTRIGGVPVTKPEKILIDIASMLSPSALEDAVDDFARRRKSSVGRLLSRILGSRSPGAPILRRLLQERVGRPISGSGRENSLKRLLAGARLPRPEPQHVILDDDGIFVAQVDFAYPQFKLAIEFDGYEMHSSRKAWEYDRARQNRMVELGWLPLRITDKQLKQSPQSVIRSVMRRVPVRGTVERRTKRK